MFLDKKTLLKIWKLIVIYEVNKEDTVIIVSLLIPAWDKIKDLGPDRIRTNVLWRYYVYFLQEFVDSFSRALAYEYSSQGVEVQVCFADIL